MQVRDKVVVVTGAAHGIGEAMAERFATDGAKLVVLGDLDGDRVARLADRIGSTGGKALSMPCDVSDEAQLKALADLAVAEGGQIDLFCSNAGVIVSGSEQAPDADWELAWGVNVMAHVYAARAVLPAMLERGEGYLLNTCSAAGLLTSLGAAPYAASKHAAVAFSEWLAITYGSKGIGVSALCPQGVRTKMIEDAIASGSGDAVGSGGDLMEAQQVADIVMTGLAEDRFLILTHPETQTYAERKVGDVDRWIKGMRKFASQ